MHCTTRAVPSKPHICYVRDLHGTANGTEAGMIQPSHGQTPNSPFLQSIQHRLELVRRNITTDDAGNLESLMTLVQLSLQQVLVDGVDDEVLELADCRDVERALEGGVRQKLD